MRFLAFLILIFPLLIKAQSMGSDIANRSVVSDIYPGPGRVPSMFLVPATDTLLQPEGMRSDFNFLREKLEQTHPGLYKRRSKEAMQHLMDSLSKTIDRPLGFLAFYSKIAFLMAETRCEHSYANMGTRGDELMKKWKMLPFQLFFSGTKPMVIVNGTGDRDIVPGDELVSINGRPIDIIISTIRQYLPADGFMTSPKDHWLSSMNFNMAYNQFIEQPEAYDVVFKKADGSFIRRSFSTGLSFREINKNALANPVNKTVLDASKRGDKMRKMQFALTFETNQPVAVMTIRTFATDKKKFQNKIDGFFSEIAEKKPTDLIIDLSYNGGGEEELAAYLMSYLIDKPTKFMEMEYLIDTSEAMFALSNIPAEVRMNKYAYIDSMQNGISKAKITEYSMELQMMQPRQNGFHGRVWLYVNGGTASAASTFSAVAQSNKRAMLVGDETSGSFSGGGTVLGLDLRLPYSGIQVHSSVVYQVFPTKGRDPNRGVVPEIAFIPDFKALTGDNREWIELILARIKAL